MKDLFLYLQLVVLVMNVIAFIYIMHEERYQYKAARAIILIVLTAGMIVNIGKVTFLTVLFTSSTFISLINIEPHGAFNRFIEKCRGYFNRREQHIQNIQGSHKALHRKA